jgi:hypothetical protein
VDAGTNLPHLEPLEDDALVALLLEGQAHQPDAVLQALEGLHVDFGARANRKMAADLGALGLGRGDEGGAAIEPVGQQHRLGRQLRQYLLG